MEKRYTITCTEEQLRLISQAVEDWHRFLAGECELLHATSFVEPSSNMHEVQEILNNRVRPYIVPELATYYGSAYKWNGGNCPNEWQRKAIAMSYGIYRQILHFFALKRAKEDNKLLDWNTYTSATLQCEEQGPLIQIKEHDNKRKR